MGLNAVVARLAVSRVHVLVVEPPGHFALRVAAERSVDRRGWVVADGPADADLLLVLGSPPVELRELADRLYESMPGPRARVDVTAADLVDAALDRGARQLADTAAQRADARNRAAEPGEDVPLADGADDRDGLEMDVLHVPLGPVLRWWPAGLTLTCALHGDVVMDAEAAWTGPPAIDAAATTADGWVHAAAWLDAATAVLTLAGSPHRTTAVRRARDACLDRDPSAAGLVRTERRRVVHSPLLRWSLRSLAAVDGLTAEASPPFTGDAATRLAASLEAAADELDGREVRTPEPSVLVDRLPALVAGRDLGEVRVLVAGLSPALGPAAGRWATAHASPAGQP